MIFRRTTAKYLHAFSRNQQLEYLAEICRHNARALNKALRYCRDHDIKNFRINSQILPLKTHPDVGYRIKDLPFHMASKKYWSLGPSIGNRWGVEKSLK